MAIPVNSFANVVDALVGIGNGKTLANFDPVKIKRVKKVISVDMTDIEKRFDPQTNNTIINKILLCRQIEFLINAIIKNRNLEFFARKELERRASELDEYLKSKMEHEKRSQQEHEALLALNRNALHRPDLEKIVALEKLIQELEKQNKILIAQYDAYVHDFAEELSVELEEIEPYAGLSEKARIELVEKVFRAAIDVEVSFAEKRAAKSEHVDKKHKKVKEKENQPPILFFDQDEVKLRADIERMITLTTKQELSAHNISPTKKDLNKFTDVFSERFYQKKDHAVVIKIQISHNRVVIEQGSKEKDRLMAGGRMSLKSKKLD